MAPLLSDFSQAVADTVEAASSPVVRVEGRDRLHSTGIIWSADGTIVTCHHTLERDDNIIVGLANGDTVKATLAGRDPGTDLAVLRTDGRDLRVADWESTDDLRVGHLVLALGRPGRDVRATMGMVSVLSSAGSGWRSPGGGTLDRYLQTDLVMYPGFSGGPLVGASGRFLGLNTSALLRNVSVAIPWVTVREVTEALLAYGRVRRGYLGVGIQPTRLPAEVSSQLGQESGLLINSVEPGAAAEKGGLFLGDTIVSVAGNPIRQVDDLMAALGPESVNAEVVLQIVRGGRIHEQTVVVEEHP